MEQINYWAIDELMAAELLTTLGREQSDLEATTRVFAKCRASMLDWLAEQQSAQIADMLEDVSTEQFQHHKPEWAEGFLYAQRLVVEFEGLRESYAKPSSKMTKGAFLRDSIRSAKKGTI